MAIPILPHDIITNILSRLQSKTLICFKSVSKQWYSLINSPHFINLHLTQTLISDISPNLIICRTSLFSSPISDNYTNPNFYFSELDHPVKRCSPQILGSINGVLCISYYSNSCIFLYNPSTKTKRLIIHLPDINPHFGRNRGNCTINYFHFGFGFDSASGDYKLLKMIETLKNNVLLYSEASVYSLRNDSWKCVTDQTMMEELVLHNSMAVLVNEVLHFIVSDSKLNPKVMCFNIRTETFSILDSPKLDARFSRKSYAIQELGGCFVVMVNYQEQNNEMLGFGLLLQLDLWVMKEYGNKESWFRLFSICDPGDMLQVSFYVRPLVYSKSKERVLLVLDGKSLGWYCWGNNTFEKITVHGGCQALYAIGPCDTWTFLDSLVSLGKDKDES